MTPALPFLMVAPVPTQIPKLSPSTRPTAHFSLPQPAPTTYCPLSFVSSRRLHHVASISLPFSAASAYFASPRGCTVPSVPMLTRSDPPAHQTLLFTRA